MSKPKTEITSQIIIEPAKVNPYLERWSSWNAVFILSATIVSFYYQNLIPLTLISFFTFSSLVYFAKRTKPAIPILTPANLLTGVRFLAVLVLASSFDHLENYLIAGIGLLILIADGIDGKLARSSGKVSEFGEYFEREAILDWKIYICYRRSGASFSLHFTTGIFRTSCHFGRHITDIFIWKRFYMDTYQKIKIKLKSLQETPAVFWFALILLNTLLLLPAMVFYPGSSQFFPIPPLNTPRGWYDTLAFFFRRENQDFFRIAYQR
ncbi:MAG: CDP-alcohol phosphatidyltransferase family protein [Calditrichia bacterium]